MKEEEFEVYHAVLEDGNEVEISIPDNEYLEEIWKSLKNATLSGGFFNEEGWTDVEIKLRGRTISYLNCRKVVGLR